MVFEIHILTTLANANRWGGCGFVHGIYHHVAIKGGHSFVASSMAYETSLYWQNRQMVQFVIVA